MIFFGSHNNNEGIVPIKSYANGSNLLYGHFEAAAAMVACVRYMIFDFDFSYVFLSGKSG